MANKGRKCVWIPDDQMEIIYERVREYRKRTGKYLRVPDALIQILDEYDVMIDAKKQNELASVSSDDYFETTREWPY